MKETSHRILFYASIIGFTTLYGEVLHKHKGVYEAEASFCKLQHMHTTQASLYILHLYQNTDKYNSLSV